MPDNQRYDTLGQLRGAIELGHLKGSEMFPNGRDIWFEGDDPAGYRAWARARTGFDPGEHWTEDPSGYRFHCPAEHLNVLYGDSPWPVGS
jgi:hypothetical protein